MAPRPQNEFVMPIPTTHYDTSESQEPAGQNGGSNHNRGLNGSNHSRGLRRNKVPRMTTNSSNNNNNNDDDMGLFPSSTFPLNSTANDDDDNNNRPKHTSRSMSPLPRNNSGNSTSSMKNMAKGFIRGVIPRRHRSNDGVPQQRVVQATTDKPPRRTFSGLRGKKAPSYQQLQQAEPVVLDASVTPVVGAPPSSSSSAQNSPAIGGKGKGLRRSVPASAPGAVSQSNSSTEEDPRSSLPPSRTASFDSTDGSKVRSRVRASAPGAVSQATTTTATTTTTEPQVTPFTRTSAGDSITTNGGGAPADGKIRGRVRASAPGAVSESSNNNNYAVPTEPTLGASLHGRSVAPLKMTNSSFAPAATIDSSSVELKKNNNNSNKKVTPETSESETVHNTAANDSTNKYTNNKENDAAEEEEEQNTEDPQAIRRKQIQEIMKDANLNQREKQVKMQELMATGMPKSTTAASASSEPEATTTPPVVPTQMEKAPTAPVAPAFADSDDPQAIRRKQIQEIMKDPKLSQREKQVRMQELMAGGMPPTSADQEIPSTTTTSGDSTVPSSTTTTTTRGLSSRRGLGDDSGSTHHSRRLATGSTDLGSSRHEPGGNPLPPSGASSRVDVGGAPQGKMRRTTPASMPGAVNVSEQASGANDQDMNSSQNDSQSPSPNCRVSRSERLRDVNPQPSTGVGGAPQGKMRRTTQSSEPSRPGAVSVAPSPPDGSSNSGAADENAQGSTGIGGAPQGKIRRVVTVSAPETAAAGDAPPRAAANADAALRRHLTEPSVRPGAVSVVEPSVSPAGASTGVGGAPLGKLRRTVVGNVSQPGANGDLEPSVPAEPGVASTGVGGAPQGKIRRTTATMASQPGAVSVTEPSNGSLETRSSHGTGVGGAPQGKVRRTTATAASQPGAVSVTEPTNASLETRSSHGTGVGGAPQGKIRRTTATAASQPGAVSVTEPSNASLETRSSHSTGVGGAPQGKIRRTTATAASQPGAVSVTEPSNASLETRSSHSTGVGGAPQGKMRRTTAAFQPGATSQSVPSQPGDEMALSSHSHRSEADCQSSSGGVGGAPQGKIRRATASQPPRPGAMSVSERSRTVDLGSIQNKEPAALVPAISVRALRVEPDGTPSTASTVERDMMAKSSVRRSRPAIVSPGAQSVKASDTTECNQGNDTEAIVSSVENDMLAKSGARRSKARTPVRPGAETVSASEPNHGDDTDAVVSSVENEMMTKAGARRSRLSGPAHPGAQSVSEPEPLDHSANEASQAEHDLLSKTRARGSGDASRGMSRGLSRRSNAEESVDGAAQTMERDLLAKNHSRRARATAPGMEPVSESVASREPEDISGVVEAVESDLQSKLSSRTSRGNRPAVPGATPVDRGEAEEVEAALLRKDPRASMQSVDNPALDDDENAVGAYSASDQQTGTVNRMQQKVMQMEQQQEARDRKLEELGESGSGTISYQTTNVSNRMEQKVLQMEEEQQARDQKLDEIEQMGFHRNRVGPDSKIHPSPEPGQPDDIENGFLNPDPEALRQAEEDGLAIAVAVDEEEEPDVYDVELKMYDPAAKPPFHKNRRFRLYSCCIALLVIVAIAVVGGLFGSGALSSSSKELIYVTDPPSASPTQAPTSTRDTAVRGEIVRVVGDIVNEPDSVYEKALNWISFDDPMQLDEFSENLIQRYTLALFYFQTSQEGPWTSCNPPEEGEDSSCTFYEHNRDPETSEEFWMEREEPEVRWLSEKHECEWAEIDCHPPTEGSVIAIDILGQNLTGTLPDELKHLERLMWLTVSYNFFSGTIPEVYGEFPYLTIFECNSNFLTGQIPSGFFRQSNLLQLNPNSNLLTGPIPSDIGLLTTLHSLFWFANALSGTLPSEIGNLEDARNLWLYDNQLTGPIPSEIGNLGLLEQLKLSSNMIEGPLPSELGRLQNMKEFLFAWNDVGGSTIPEEVYNMENLIFLDFNDGNFGGTLSTEVGKLGSSFQGLKVGNNVMTGTIPTELGLLENLLLIHVHNNFFTGSIPIEVCQLRGPENLQFLNADCAGTFPEVSCIGGCCSGCCDENGQCQRMY